MYSSLAQAFSTEGEGFALKGESVPRSSEKNHTAYLSRQQAEHLGSRILSEYRERTGKDPTRLVLHKTTMFTDSEREGFRIAFQQIPLVEYINIAPGDFRLVQRSAYPPKRGTLCRINDDAAYLFTTGFIPEWNTYPGMHVPVPIRINTDADVDILRAAHDVLALARMNWNTAFDTTGAPITLRFARQVGGIMQRSGKRSLVHLIGITCKTIYALSRSFGSPTSPPVTARAPDIEHVPDQVVEVQEDTGLVGYHLRQICPKRHDMVPQLCTSAGTLDRVARFI